MGKQIEINERMRSILVDWLIEVHNKFELMPETLYLTVDIVDQYLSMRTVLRRELQLVGVSAMLIASKYEEIWAPEVNTFSHIHFINRFSILLIIPRLIGIWLFVIIIISDQRLRLHNRHGIY